MKQPSLSIFTRIVLLMAVYFLGGLIGKEATFVPAQVVLVWPPFGISLAAILLFGYRYWPGVAIGSLLFSFTNSGGFDLLTFCNAAGNTVGAIVCAHLLQKVQFKNSLGRVRDIAALAGFGGLLGPSVTAMFNVIPILDESEGAGAVFDKVLEWWVPNSFAVLVLTPLILAWKEAKPINWRKEPVLEGILCATGLALGTFWSFQSWYVFGIQSYPFAYLPYPFLVWASLRLGQRGATTGTFMVTALAISALLEHRGPFVMQAQRDSLMLIGCYIGVLSLTTMLLAAAATEREVAEEEVRKSEKRYRGVVEDQTEMIWRFTEDGTVTFCNDAYCRFHGKTRGELIGQKYLPLLSNEDRDIPLTYFATMPAENPTVCYDYKLVQPTGEIVWQQCTTRRIFNDRGETLEFQSVAQDITRRKQIEDAARDAEHRLRAIVNSMVDGLLVCDVRGNVTSCNPAAEKILGRRSSEIVGNNIRDFVSTENRPVFDDCMDHHVRKLQTKILELRLQQKSGDLVPVDLALSRVGLGSTSLLIAVVRDISERKKLEAQFRQTQKMEAVGRLAGGIAHDFNNLLQGIGGYANLLSSKSDLGTTEREWVQQIEKSADRAAALTGQLLAFSRQQVLKPRFFSLNDVVTDIEKLLRRLIGNNIRLVTRHCKPVNAVRADPGQIEQVILNLVINARDAMPEGGTICVETVPVDFKERPAGFSDDFQPGSYVEISVTDSGAGMTPETQARLFEPFFTTKPVGKGTGLGLSIVYGIISQSGGEIRVESEFGRGTCFKIYLPRFDNSVLETNKESLKASSVPKGKETVLLVEDADAIRALLSEVLSSHGYKVVQADNGENALTCAAAWEGTIDLLVTDITMPKLDGISLARQLGAQFSDLHILYMSGYPERENSPAGGLPPNSSFIQKPFKPDAFLSKVREVLDLPGPSAAN